MQHPGVRNASRGDATSETPDTATRYVGVDVGAETLKVVELRREGDTLRVARRGQAEHHKSPGGALREILEGWDWPGVTGATVTGRLARQIALPRVPPNEALAIGIRFRRGDAPLTVASIGSRGFSVLDLRADGSFTSRENSRCSQGTGNFLRQLVERFGLTVEQASAECVSVQDPAALSGRCPVLLKTDMTHLANHGEERARILAGLFDALCDNLSVLLKPRASARVALVGGVARSERVRDTLARLLARRGLRLLDEAAADVLFYEALGCAVLASQRASIPPCLEELVLPPQPLALERVPALTEHLPRVRRLPRPEPRPPEPGLRVVLGLDIGSTGSKAVALECSERRVVWESYLATGGDPVRAARTLVERFVESPAGVCAVVALGVTGSGREITSSLLRTCYGIEAVYVLNEIAAHAEGARHYDAAVDTIFEIGGQDAKYIRLSAGRVVDAAMNEACSAGTGSFIEEQGRRCGVFRDVTELDAQALAASSGVSLGQHCSVFMAEIIDEAVAAGAETPAIVAGIYDAVIQNYLNRVKGNRTVGETVFCQGMPFSADALAAAVARRTGSRVIVPPNPGTVGALGIALLALREMAAERPPLDLRRVLTAQLTERDTFTCQATRACGEPGNRCRIDRIRTLVAGRRETFTWGGGCALWDRGSQRKKLPDATPDPFRAREALVDAILHERCRQRGRRTVAFTDVFQLKELVPFFATFIEALGFDPVVRRDGARAALQRGIEGANVAFCAPMRLYHGQLAALADTQPDFLLLPLLRELPRSADEPFSGTCPIVQGSADVVAWDLGPRGRTNVVTAVIDIGKGNFRSAELQTSCRRLASQLGVAGHRWLEAYGAAVETQERFERECRALGREALRFCRSHGIVPVVVLGRAYAIHNPVLSSGIPEILREQGALAIPADCYELDAATPAFPGIYWGDSQRLLRAAYQIRRTSGVYSLWCSHYSCGPDGFVLHFFSHLMEGKPFAIVENDGHTAAAGVKTRVEAFLHCVRRDLEAAGAAGLPRPLPSLGTDSVWLSEIRARGTKVLVPRMGHAAQAVAACLRGAGVDAECLPVADREALELGRRHTSGKECLPAIITLGSLLKRLGELRAGDQRVAIFMPSARGPCRFGVYNILDRLVLERLGWAGRAEVWSPESRNYFHGVPPGLAARACAGMRAMDLLEAALYDVRPVEARKGETDRVFRRHQHELLSLLETPAPDLSLARAAMEVWGGGLFGCADLLRRAAAELAALKTTREVPTVLLTGAVYVRLDPFACDFIIDRLEAQGIRVLLASFGEWLEYIDLVNHAYRGQNGPRARLRHALRERVGAVAWSAIGPTLGWPAPVTSRETVTAALPYLHEEFIGEAILAIGGGLREHHEGHIDAVVNLGPHECMPCKIAEAQLVHASEREALLSVSLPFNGDPLDPGIVENFAWEVHRRFEARRRNGGA